MGGHYNSTVCALMPYCLPHDSAGVWVDSSRCLVYVDYLGSADHSQAETELSFVSTTEIVSLSIQES